ncbi:DUF692 family multinuclear iron-containing protein [Williamsia sp.]|uniref:multinuclear nonheme iron-dependent oxidase n=1 Tax=Williamsia sp. TaxID=1872085 RepID=UPI001A322F58|nr:DUF692 family multinuclear iron-containing protein [Williamsia sp.]MBJ7291778.1 DUF692 family protein [Williamsia sp.]
MVPPAAEEEAGAVAAAGRSPDPSHAARAGAVGLGWRPELADMLLDDGRLGFSEVIAESICCHLPDQLAELRALDVPVITHGVSLSIASPDALADRTAVDHLRDVSQMLDSPVVSEHIAFTRTGGTPRGPHADVLDTGHLLAPPLTPESARVVAANARVVADIVGRPFVLENIASTMAFAESRWTEADYFDHLASICDTGYILDVSNVLAAASLHGTDPAVVINRYPLERVAYLHVGGGFYGPDHLYRDTHTHRVHPDAWTLLREVLANPRLRHANVLVEWDGEYRGADIACDIEVLSGLVGHDPPAFPVSGPQTRRARPRLRRRRGAYAARLNSTVTDLMLGRVPAGFGDSAAHATSNTLWGKRFFEAATADPAIRNIPDARLRFAEHARAHPRRVSPRDDARRFLDGWDRTPPRSDLHRPDHGRDDESG